MNTGPENECRSIRKLIKVINVSGLRMEEKRTRAQPRDVGEKNGAGVKRGGEFKI